MKQTREEHLEKKRIAQSVYRKLHIKEIKEYTRNYQRRPKVLAHRTDQMRKYRKEGRIRVDKSSLQFKARVSITGAIFKGTIPSAKELVCSCGEPAKEYHHFKGYETKHHRDVVAMCRPCHLELHHAR